MKKQLFIMLATTLIATTFVGCSCTGSKTATDTTTESTVESTTHTKNENTTEPEQPTTTVADIETDSNTESTTTEQESTIEEPTTEAPSETPTDKPSEQPTEKPTEKPTTVNPFLLEPSGSYTDKKVSTQGLYTFYLRTYENGAQRNMVHAYHAGIIDKYYTIRDAELIPQSVAIDVANTFNDYYAQQTPTEAPTEAPSTGGTNEEETEYDPWASWGEEQPSGWYDPDHEGGIAD